MATNEPKTYKPLVTLRDALLVALYAAVPVVIVTLTEGLKGAEGQWWYPIAAAILGAIGSYWRFRLKNS